MTRCRVFAALLAMFAALGARGVAQGGAGVEWAPYDLPGLDQTTLVSAEGSPYRIIVAKPAGAVPAKGYPVIYVVDGNAYTSLVSEIIRMNRDVRFTERLCDEG